MGKKIVFLLFFCLYFIIYCKNADAATIILRPNSAGTYQEWTLVDSTHWNATSDQSDATYVEVTGSTTFRETLNLQNSNLTYPINSVTAYMRCKAIGGAAPEKANILWRTYGTNYESAALIIGRNVFADYSEIRTTNPYTGLAWTWDEINSLEIGSRASVLGGGEKIQCSEYWIVVNYWSPEENITDCTVLNANGVTYYLVNDIIDSSAARCIEITATNVTLDCQGHVIDGIDAVDSYGIYHSSATDIDAKNVIKNCVVRDWYNGIYFRKSHNNTVTNSIIISNSYGIRLNSVSSARIYNNLLNNTNNFYFEGVLYTNSWNDTKKIGTRIYSPGIGIGGNYWTNPTGTGYSDTCTDNNTDGFCDIPYTLTTNNTDYLPLSNKFALKLDVNTNQSIYIIGQTVLVSGLLHDGGGLAIPNNNVTIRFAFPNGTIINEENVSTNSSGQYSTTLFLKLTFPGGTYTVNATSYYNCSTLTGNYLLNASNSTTFACESLFFVKYKLTYRLGTTKVNDIYRIGNYSETVDNLTVTRTLYPSDLIHAYVCTYDNTEYLNGQLLALIHFYKKENLIFLNFSATETNDNYTIELKQQINSKSLLSFTKGTCQLIDQKMYLIENQQIPRSFATLEYGLPKGQIIQIRLQNDRIKINGTDRFAKGTFRICIEYQGLSEDKKPIIWVREC